MKFLVDHNLSPALVPFLNRWFPGSIHTSELGFDRTPDLELRTYAGNHGYCILTKDTDFEHLSFLKGAPPKVVWLRIGNCANHRVRSLLEAHIDDLMAFGSNDERALLALTFA